VRSVAVHVAIDADPALCNKMAVGTH